MACSGLTNWAWKGRMCSCEEMVTGNKTSLAGC